MRLPHVLGLFYTPLIPFLVLHIVENQKAFAQDQTYRSIQFQSLNLPNCELRKPVHLGPGISDSIKATGSRLIQRVREKQGRVPVRAKDRKTIFDLISF